MRTFATSLVLSSLSTLECYSGAPVATATLECVDDLADALSRGDCSDSLLMAYIEACATGIPVEYVLPCEVSVLSCAPLECLMARDANPV